MTCVAAATPLARRARPARRARAFSAPTPSTRPASNPAIATHEVTAMTRQTTPSNSVARPAVPPPTRRELRRAAAIQAAWLAELR